MDISGGAGGLKNIFILVKPGHHYSFLVVGGHSYTTFSQRILLLTLTFLALGITVKILVEPTREHAYEKRTLHHRTLPGLAGLWKQ